MNPIFQAMKMSNNYKSVLDTIRSSRNPNALMAQMMQNTPQVSEIMNYINKCGGDPKSAFYKMAQDKGVDPSSILEMLK